ncbi:nucleotidyltransferase domain-containing protein [Nibrella viscosa]|uniref:Nucleotidyltransferase domain-containing protein n=1 Tax=Nibrella viscosa TaxID=1084524 RepID=A0ABP8JZF8_9BACT
MQVKTQTLVAEFKQAMQTLYGDRLDRIVLFGCYARGDNHDDSDIDFMVVVRDESLSRLEEINRFVETQSELSLKHNITISVLPVSLKKYTQSVLPVYHFARQEGIIL